MTTEQDPHTNREVPEGELRKKIRIHENVREYLSERSSEEGMTYSELIEEFAPDNWQDVNLDYDSDEVVGIKATPSAHEKVRSMSGSRVLPGEVLTLLVLLDAIEQGNVETAAEFMEFAPKAVWQALDIGGDGDGV